MATDDCSQNTDPLILVREGTRQDQRFPTELNPDYAPVDDRQIEHGLVFARAYSQFLSFYKPGDVVSNGALVADIVATGNWQGFFSQDVSVQLAVAAVQDVDSYRINIKSYFDFLNDRDNATDAEELKNNLGYLFSSAATLAQQLDQLKNQLPDEILLKASLQNLIKNQLAPAFKRLLLYYRDGLISEPLPAPPAPYFNELTAPLRIMGGQIAFKTLRQTGLSNDWLIDDPATNWSGYMTNINNLAKYPATKVYGADSSLFGRVNHLSTHNLFSSVFEQFLKVYARIIKEAKQSLDKTLTDWDKHEPHYALFLAFLQLFTYARNETNTLTQKHLDFYYRQILKFKEKPAQAGQVHLIVELVKNVAAVQFKPGELFKAGKDDLGLDAFFANNRDFVANPAKLAALKTIYRHGDEKVGLPTGTTNHAGRYYAAPLANSDDGLGAKLTSVDGAWQPFFNKSYENGRLKTINMPQAELGFAIASHYLWLAGGTRTIIVEFTLATPIDGLTTDHKDEISCLLTSEKAWLDVKPDQLAVVNGKLTLKLTLTGAEPAITPYVAKTHGQEFATQLPVLMVKLKHLDSPYLYPLLQEAQVTSIDITVRVDNLKSLAVSNDFGEVDISKPFQPFGALPVNGGGLIVGSKEVFQKNLSTFSLNIKWQNEPKYYLPAGSAPIVATSFLVSSNWSEIEKVTISGRGTFPVGVNFKTSEYSLNNAANATVIETTELIKDEAYNINSRYGYLRLVFIGDLGFNQYQIDLTNFLANKVPKPPTHPGPPILGPVAEALWVNYEAKQTINLNLASLDNFNTRKAQFLHLAPFGHSEQHPWSKTKSEVTDKAIYLLPQFYSEYIQQNAAKVKSYDAELYLGITDLSLPQNLALLFQVADGTANPLTDKPKPHLHWSYLKDNEWLDFDPHQIEDQTGGWVKSGLVNLAVPKEATNNNTLLPSGMHWLRVAVAQKSDAVCRLRLIAAQGLSATFKDQGNDPAFPAKPLPENTISKLAQPNAAVKQITQPFSSFGGRGAEPAQAFYNRVSERLRHKDRAITLWDYERLILEAFPQIYKVLCLNHTWYEPNPSGTGIYKELAAGHVSIVTLPNLQTHNLHDPLRPYTSLGLLEDIKVFLLQRAACFVSPDKLHVKNPQFEEVGVQCKVRFLEGFDETFYKNQLQAGITRFLSPWAFSNDAVPTFAGKIYQSVLINFIEEQPFVDYVTELSLTHSLDCNPQNPNCKPVSGLTEVTASKAVSILVSAPSHDIGVINANLEQATRANSCPCESL